MCIHILELTDVYTYFGVNRCAAIIVKFLNKILDFKAFPAFQAAIIKSMLV